MRKMGEFSMACVGELASLIERFTGTDGAHTTAIPRVFLHRGTQAGDNCHQGIEFT